MDPSLAAVLAGRRIAGEVDVAFSYSVIQHFGRPDAEAALREMARVLAPDSEIMVQMANALGVRSFYHQARRGFRAIRVSQRPKRFRRLAPVADSVYVTARKRPLA